MILCKLDLVVRLQLWFISNILDLNFDVRTLYFDILVDFGDLLKPELLFDLLHVGCTVISNKVGANLPHFLCIVDYILLTHRSCLLFITSRYLDAKI